MHVLALYKEGRWPYAEILPKNQDAFREALNQLNDLKEQFIEYDLEALPLVNIENFLLMAKKDSNIEQQSSNDSWSIVATIDENNHLNITGYSQIEKTTTTNLQFITKTLTRTNL